MSNNINPDQIAIIRDNQQDILKQRLIEQEVCEYWGVIFSERGIKSLTKQDVTGFMSYSQNKRWREIQNEDITQDMERLKRALLTLINVNIPISTRLNLIEPGHGEYAVANLGKAKMTPILLVSNPKEFGVWNDYSERALRAMGVFPEFSPGQRLGDQYERVNEELLRLAQTYRVSLWRLDVILEQIARLVR